MSAPSASARRESNDGVSVIALDSRQARTLAGCCSAGSGSSPQPLLTLPHSQPLDEVGSLSVMGDACAPLAGNGDVAHVLTREEEQLHMAHGKAKNERRAALDSGDKDENSGGKGGKSFFSRAGKEGLRTLTRVRSRRPVPHVGGAETLAQSMRVHELLFYARTDDLARLRKFVQKERINLQSTAACDPDGRTALHIAAAANASAVATWLLELGCEVNAMDAFLRTPLREASDAGHADMQRKLIAAGGMVHFNDAHLDGGSFCESFRGGGGSGQGLAAAMRALGCSNIVPSAGHTAGLSALPPASPLPATRDSGPGNSGSAGTAFAGEDWELDPSTLEMSTTMLGSGAFGEVYSAYWRGTRVAVKRLKGDFADDTSALAEFRAELAVWCRLHHPHVCQFLGAVTRRGGGMPPSLVLELCPLGNLGTLMQRHATWGTFIKWDDAIRYTAGIAAGMHYLHGRRPHAVMHRDLKPANCLIDGSNNIRLSDFGLSKLLRCGGGNEGSTRSGGGIDVDVADKAFLLTGETGAYKYMAPEVFRHERYSCKVDVYAFAMICYEMYEGVLRPEDPAAHAAAAANPSTPHRPDLALLAALGSKRCLLMAELIRRCWDPDPKKRPHFAFITADVREIRRLKEYDLPDGAAGPARKGGRTSTTSSNGGGAAPEGGCCAVQ